MKLNTLAACLVALSTSSTWAAPVSGGNSTEPCSLVRDEVIRVLQANSTAFLFEPQTAQDCLLSIPFDSQRSVALITELTKHLQFQSTLETLKNPPSSYPSKGVDILGGLSSISDKASQNGYSSQYEFDGAIMDLLGSANEGHLSASLCTTSIFSFQIPFILSSISEDGISPPEVYSYRQILGSLASNASSSISSITTINGQNASQFIENMSALSSSQDPDARYNAQFGSFGRPSTGSQPGEFVNSGRWPGFSSVSLQYNNGTKQDIPLQASFQLSVDPTDFNVTNGADVFRQFCLPSTLSPTTSESGNSTQTNAPIAATFTAGPEGYPAPVIRSDYNLIAGYHLEEKYNDTIVLFIPNFGTDGTAPAGNGDLPDNEIAAFAEVAASFVKDAKAQGKKRIIIDVTGNPGGTTISGFNLYKLFYPQPPIYMENRYRDHPTQKLMLKGLSDAGSEYNQTELFGANVLRQWAWQGQVAPDGNATTFKSWEDWYGPKTLSDGSIVTEATNFNNFSVTTSALTPIQGYGEQTTNFTSPPFEGSDIIIMGDGMCASTCPIFVNLMKQHGSADIKTVVFGGRPNNNPMQLLGGTRGSQSYTFANLASDAESILIYALNRTANSTRPVLTDDELTQLNQSRPLNPLTFPLKGISGGVNLRNNYNQDNPELALQFAYESADCRLYFTPENVADPASQWYAAADAIWGGKACAATSSNENYGSGGSGGGNSTTEPTNTPPTPSASNTGAANPTYTGAATSMRRADALYAFTLALGVTVLAL